MLSILPKKSCQIEENLKLLAAELRNLPHVWPAELWWMGGQAADLLPICHNSASSTANI